jgi:poly(beta-D-mannuronate) lyase
VKSSLLIFAASVGTSALVAEEITLTTPIEAMTAAKSAKPGDTVILTSGEFHNVVIKFSAKGTADSPITFRAAKPGRTIFTGASQLRFSGAHLRIQGFIFRDTSPTLSDVIEFRTGSDELASHCTLIDCAVTADPSAQAKHKDSKWCSIYGLGNTVEHCTFSGKANKGTTMVVWLSPEIQCGQHVIRDCHFLNRPKLGKNGGETIRIGDSKTAHLTASCKILRNRFFQCNGEGEIISNKSCGNLYEGNTFLECEGALTLRHGHRCEVRGNLFNGNNKKLTGGVRVIGEDHRVRANEFVQLQGDGIRSAITFMNAIPDTPPEGYQQVKHATVEGNLILDCKTPFTIGLKHDAACILPPLAVTVENNTVYAPKSNLISLQSKVSGWTWEGNKFTAGELGDAIPGVTLTEHTQPTARLSALNEAQVGARF